MGQGEGGHGSRGGGPWIKGREGHPLDVGLTAVQLRCVVVCLCFWERGGNVAKSILPFVNIASV
jgi:hypothetical protein